MSTLGTVTFEPRFRGPPASANGGYAAGRLAEFVEAPVVEVRLAAPPPLERPLDVVATGDGVVELRDGGDIIALARPGELELDVPRAVDYETAVTARARILATFDAERHVFPTCFGCGPLRERGDALLHIAGPVQGREDRVLACPMTTDAELPQDDTGAIDDAVVWAALDCPSGWAAFDTDTEPHMLGTFTGELRRPIHVDTPHVVMAWSLGGEGRKRYGAAAIVDQGGEIAAIAAAVWIRLRAD